MIKTKRDVYTGEAAVTPFSPGNAVRRLLKTGWFLPSLQGITVLLLITGIVSGFLGTQEYKDSLTRTIFWDLWWQAGIVTVLFMMGKTWCAICPLRAIGRIAERFSYGITFPKVLKSAAVPIVMYIVVVRLILYLPGVALPRSPWNTAAYFLAFILLAAAVGIVFKRGSFCRYVCPLTSAVDVYAMTAPVELRPDRSKCEICATRDCIKGNISTSGCRYGIFPGNLHYDRHCTFCLDCVKACSNDSMHFRIRPFFSGLWSEVRPRAGESLISVIVFTLIFFRMGTGHHPAWNDITSALGVPPQSPYFAAAHYMTRFFVCLVLVPLLFTGVSAISARINNEETKKHLSVFGYGYLPFCVITGLLQFGWFDLGTLRLTLPVFLGAAASVYVTARIGLSHLKGPHPAMAIACHIILLTFLSLVILIFQNLWPMQYS